MPSAESFAKYHDERAGYGGASQEFHERAASFLRSLEAERDEWKRQHAALRTAATDAVNVLGELDDDGVFSPCPHPSLSGAVRDEIAPWVEGTWRNLLAALDEPALYRGKP